MKIQYSIQEGGQNVNNRSAVCRIYCKGVGWTSRSVVVDRTIDEKGVLLTLTVNPADLGRVIGKRGSTAQSLRTLLRALGAKNDARYNLKIVNNDGFSGERESNSYNDHASVDNSTDETVENESSYAENTRKELQNSTILIYN